MAGVGLDDIAADSTWVRGPRFLADAFLRSYAQVLLGRSRWVGGVLLAATALSPRLAVTGALAVLVALGTALLLGLCRDLIRSGLFSYSALLFGLGLGALRGTEGSMLALIVVGAALTVPLTAALHSALWQTFNLPALALPFLFTFHLALAAAPLLGASSPAPVGAGPDWGLPQPLDLFLRSLGAIFFLPRLDAGLVVFAALLSFSRVGVVLAVVGFAMAYGMGVHLAALPSAELAVVLGYNFILTAVAIGGVWFVPSPASFLLAIAAVAACGVIALGAKALLAHGVPLAILPFNLTVILVLYAMRQRVRDGHPKAVDFLLGTPEENLHYYQTRVSRFGARYAVRFQAPFLGRWVCTQGVDGPDTHRGPWRHALDFQVRGTDGRTFDGGGTQPSDFHCYRLPVLAAADGTVVRLVNHVPDNPIGEMNLQDNWGNLVILAHGPGLYSVVAHLSPGSIKVREGQIVRQGELLGLCGSSGRSAVPHLHFQLQSVARIGAPTLPVELHDVVLDRDAPRLLATCVPEERDVVRNVEPQPFVGRLLSLPVGERLRFVDPTGQRAEEVVHEIDLLGNLQLRSASTGALLYFDRSDRIFTIYDALGPRRSVLHLLRAALPRVPTEITGELTWTDHLPRTAVESPPWRLARDLVAPLLGRDSYQMRYHGRRRGNRLEITGTSVRTDSRGEAVLRTEAILHEGLGIERVALTVRGRTRAAVRAEAVNTTPARLVWEYSGGE